MEAKWLLCSESGLQLPVPLLPTGHVRHGPHYGQVCCGHTHSSRLPPRTATQVQVAGVATWVSGEGGEGERGAAGVAVWVSGGGREGREGSCRSGCMGVWGREEGEGGEGEGGAIGVNPW